MRNLSGIVVVIFFIIVFMVMGSSKKKRSVKPAPMIFHNVAPTAVPLRKSEITMNALCQQNKTFCNSGPIVGMHELELDTQVRGQVPHANQPDHTSNLWKCDRSHSSHEDILEGFVNADDYMNRAKIVNQDVKDSSDMHIMSRFAIEKS